MLQLAKAEKRLAFSKIFLDEEDHLPNDLILRIIDYFNLIRWMSVRIYNSKNELLNDMYLPENKTIRDLKHIVSEFMNHQEYRMLYKIDRDGEYETRADTHYPDEYLLSNAATENLELFVIPLAKISRESEGGGKRRNRKSKRKSKRRSIRKKRKSKRKSKRKTRRK